MIEYVIWSIISWEASHYECKVQHLKGCSQAKWWDEIKRFSGIECFPFKTIKCKALNSFRKPWLTKSLLRSINKKNKLYKQYLRHRSNEKLLKYKAYKNKLTDLFRVGKRLYFQNQIELNKTTIKQTWRILNNAISQNKTKKLTHPLVDENGESITSTEKVANKFCKYFTNIGPNLADKIAPASKSIQDFRNSVPLDSLSSFHPVTAEELKSIAEGFRDGKAPGADNIPISIIKKTLDLISDPLLSIINLSFSSGVFPDRLKISKLVLAYHKIIDQFLYFLPFLKFLKELFIMAYFNS